MLPMLHTAQMYSSNAGLPPYHQTRMPHSIAERKRLFSAIAQVLVSYMLNGEVEIHLDDIQLETENENCGAIFINERVSCNSAFQEMWAKTSCATELKTLAHMVLHR